MKLTATDRKTLIRLASSMEKGSRERKAILSGLEKTARMNWKTVRLDRSSLNKANAVRWMYMNRAGNFDSYIAFRVPEQGVKWGGNLLADEGWAVSKGRFFQPQKMRNLDNAGLLTLWKKTQGWVPDDEGGTPYDSSGENPSHEALHAIGKGEALISTAENPPYRQWHG